MDYLVFQIQAPISAWGETAVGEYRPTANYPSESALLGLLAAALGIDRADEASHQALQAGYGFAIGVQSTGRLLRDYHTAQVPGRVSLKNRPHRTRKDELRIPKDDLNTILSTRDYRQDAACLVVVKANSNAPYTLSELVQAIQKPRFVLYLGRKACPPAMPLWPQMISADHVLAALEHYRQTLESVVGEGKMQPLEQLVWGDGIKVGISEDIQVVRKDRLLSRQQWQFGDRAEYVAFLGGQ